MAQPSKAIHNVRCRTALSQIPGLFTRVSFLRPALHAICKLPAGNFLAHPCWPPGRGYSTASRDRKKQQGPALREYDTRRDAVHTSVVSFDAWWLLALQSMPGFRSCSLRDQIP